MDKILSSLSLSLSTCAVHYQLQIQEGRVGMGARATPPPPPPPPLPSSIQFLHYDWRNMSSLTRHMPADVFETCTTFLVQTNHQISKPPINIVTLLPSLRAPLSLSKSWICPSTTYADQYGHAVPDKIIFLRNKEMPKCLHYPGSTCFL